MSGRPDQHRTPLLDAIRAYSASDPAYFCIPSHHRGNGADPGLKELLQENVFAADLTETDGMDDLHAPTGAILEAEDLAAEAWGSDRCFFLVNGSASGNEAMFLATLRPGDQVLIDRQAHVSVLSALILTGAAPVWIPCTMTDGWELPSPVTAEAVDRALNDHPDVRAVFITSPSYYGISADIRSVANVCHEHQKPLLVDEAHGAHFSFSEEYPEDAVLGGVDLVVQSMHKTGGSLTQSSLLHLQGGRVDPEAVQNAIRLVTSTSPSYLLMASLDASRRRLATEGKELLHEAKQRADRCREALSSIQGVRVLTTADLPSGADLDPLRITFSVDSGLSGTELREILFRTYAVSLEMADSAHLVAVLSWGDTEHDLDRLIGAVRDVAAKYGRKKSASDQGTGSDSLASRKDSRTGSIPPTEIPIPDVAVLPRDACFGDKETILLEEASGRIAAEPVMLYPPGVPVVCPGERISSEIRALLMTMREEHDSLHGCADPALRMIRVLKQE